MDKRTKRALLILLIVSAVIRALVAAFTGLGNDEVYYTLYAHYPALSYFDHPPMVGLFIRLFSCNLLFDSDFFMRLSPVLFGTLNTFLVFIIGCKLKDAFAGLYAALLFTASLYGFVISGIFIMPDTPLVFFWLLSLYFLLSSVIGEPVRYARYNLLLAGITIGLAMLSKYHGVFLWAGAGLFVLLYNRKWLARWELYAALLLSFAVFMPVLVWNYQHHWVSFLFQSDRAVMGNSLRPDLFATQIAGELFYNNPVNFFIILFSLWMMFRRGQGKKQENRLLLATSVPLILIFWGVSMIRPTLPHWTAPGYLGMMLTAAVTLSDLRTGKRFIPHGIKASLLLMLVFVVLGFLQINTGIIPMEKSAASKTSLGRNDVTLDMYGWEQVASEFAKVRSADIKAGTMQADACMLSYRWFPAAHLDHYVARPLGIKTFAIGSPDRIHEFSRINSVNGMPRTGSDAYYITSSRDFAVPSDRIRLSYSEMLPADTFEIRRSGRVAAYWFLYRLKSKTEAALMDESFR